MSFKIAIFLVWGINVLFFLTKDYVSSELDKNPFTKYKASSLTIKLSPLALSNDFKFEFYAPEIGVFSSYNFSIHVLDFNKLVRERSPPKNSFLI